MQISMFKNNVFFVFIMLRIASMVLILTTGRYVGGNISPSLYLGVTVALIGLMLVSIPLPVLGLADFKTIGINLFVAGTLLSVQIVCEEIDNGKIAAKNNTQSSSAY